MKTMRRVSTVVIASAAAVALFGGGIASAATVHGAGTAAVPPDPTVDYKVCGTVYAGASDPSNGNRPLPSGAAAIEGVTITGSVYSFGASTPSSTFSTISAADGTYCLQGDSSMASTIIALGKVVVTVSPTSITPPTPAITAKLPYAGTIRAAQFLSHKVTVNSANQLNFAYN